MGPVWACATPGAAQTAAISDQQASAALDPALGNIARLCCQHDRLARSVQPMMANDWRERMSERQMAIIGAPYGLAMGEASWLFRGQACPEMMGSALQWRLDCNR
jgi:hypothetical protein